VTDKAKWAIAYLCVAVIPILIVVGFSIRLNETLKNFLVLAPTIGLFLTAILGWQINQTRIFWSTLFLLCFYQYFQHLPDPGPFRSASLEIIAAAFPLSLCVLFLIRESRLWSDHSLVRLLLAISPFLFFLGLYHWPPEVYHKLFYFREQVPVGALKIPPLAWVTLTLVVVVTAYLPDLKIKPYFLSQSITLIPLTSIIQFRLWRDSLPAKLKRPAGADFDSLVIIGFTAIAVILLHSVLHMYWKKVYMDILTGVPNRQALDERLHTLRAGYALAMVDIDHFKKFNDTYGHAEGDNVLRMVAQHLEEHLGMRVYRYGGEEFCVVFESDDAKNAVEMMEKARASMAKRKFKLRQGQRKKGDFGIFFPKTEERSNRGGVHITASMGVAFSGKDPESYEKVIKQADKCLYEAKEKGRNRVVS
jgi:diguanylate cyclase (GGDEF)-like protein